MDAKKIERIIAKVGEVLTEKFHRRVKEDGVQIIGFDGKNLKIREVWKDSNGHYHQSKNIKDTIGQFLCVENDFRVNLFQSSLEIGIFRYLLSTNTLPDNC